MRGIYAVRGNGEDKGYFDWPWLPEAPEDCELLAVVRLPGDADIAPIMRQLPSKGIWGLWMFSVDISSREILMVDGVCYSATDVLRGQAPKTVEVLWRRRPSVGADNPQCPDCGAIMDDESVVGLCYGCRFRQSGIGRVRAVYRHREVHAWEVMDLVPFQDLPEEYEIVAVVRICREALAFFTSSPMWGGWNLDEVEIIWRMGAS
ncbi:MAG: hypothetical protein F4Y24_08890 [Gemmatimonadetes bacterium]|nr:hypothetical protein [Gemmatimonadota bacterium]MYG22667.1 hypothetical protein [Gemmatimonadota bacterium]MYJ39131.1 hypothetical protein [Gemmatimonadota bacterium]